MKRIRRRYIGGGAAAILAAIAGIAQILTSGDKSHDLTPNATDGTVDSEYPAGDKPPGGVTLAWDLVGFPSFAALTTGTPVSHNDCQYLSGTGAAAATIDPIHVSGDNAISEGWAEASCLLTHPGDNAGSGVFKLRATNGAITADSPNITWAYTVPVTADWDWSEADGLANGAVSGGGNWVAFNGATLNADPNADNYLQITQGVGWGGFSGISSHHAQPLFISGNTYSCSVTIVGSGTHDEIWIQIGLGTAVEFAGTGAIVHDVVSGVGTQNIVFHGNGQAAEGATTRISAMSCTGTTNIFNFASATYSVNEATGTLEVGVTRSQPTAATASITVSRTAGVDAVATVTDTTLNWAVSEGGTKYSTLDINGDGQVTIGISSPSVGTVGAIASTVVTVDPAPVSGSTDFPRLGMVWLGGGDFGPTQGAYQQAQAIENMRRRHLVITGQWPELQAGFGVSHESVFAAVKAASTIDTKTFIYMDQDSVYKASATTNYSVKRNKMQEEGWWLYANGASGTTVDSWWGPDLTTINITSFAPTDTATGMKAMQWMLTSEWDWMRNGAQGNTVAPSVNGPYSDNINASPRVNGDWNRTGGADNADPYSPPWNIAPKTWYRAGIAAGVTAFRAANPGVLIIGNLEFLNVASRADLPEYDGLFDGGTFEAITGLGSSYESWMTTATLVARIQQAEDMIRDPMLGMLNGFALDGSATNYREMRHFLTLTLVTSNMTAGWERYFWHDNFDWYEEYDFNLGQATEARRTAPDANTTWRRDFDNGIAIWCPRQGHLPDTSPNIPGALALGGTFYALQGQASAWLTDGQAVTSITCPTEHEGIILSRTPTAFVFDWVNPLELDAANDDVYEYRKAA